MGTQKTSSRGRPLQRGRLGGYRRMLSWHSLRRLAPDMREKRRDSEWHHRVQVGGAPHDADVGKFGLRLARKMRSNPRTQRGRGFARLKHLEMCNIWRSEDAIPSLFSLVCVGIETGLL